MLTLTKKRIKNALGQQSKIKLLFILKTIFFFYIYTAEVNHLVNKQK